jgi:hypothetical protein
VAEVEAIEASEEFAERDPKTLERYFLNKYLPFFNDRTVVSKVDMGFTEITAANVNPELLRSDGQALPEEARCVDRLRMGEPLSGGWTP